MLLKSLDLQGFKSFPDKTHLDFPKGFTAVVGPNGSGKSNISDAVRWVLGEQSTKMLRGSKMEDVIFVGSKMRKAQGYAQVSLTFENADRALPIEAGEVCVTRKYYRSGDSEYLINGEPVLLKQVNELFMDTGFGKDGYSLIGQGKIDEIVSAKSADRREIFEEAAGITKFRHRKQESEKRLLMAEENLVRLRDILNELEGRIGPLKEQSEKAKVFSKLENQKESLEISIWMDDLNTFTQRLREQEDSRLAAQQQYQEASDEIEEITQNVTRASAYLENCQLQVEKLRVQKEEQNELVASMQANIAVLQNDKEHGIRDIERLQEEKDGFVLSKEQVQKDYVEKKTQLKTLEQQIAELEARIKETEQKLLQLNEDGSAVHSDVSEFNQSLNRLALQRSKEKLGAASLQNRIEECSMRQSEIQKNLSAKQADFYHLEEEQKEVLSFFETLAGKRQELQNAQSGYALKLQTRREKLQRAKDAVRQSEKEWSNYQQKVKILQDLERNMEGFSYSVKRVLGLSKSGALSGIHGTVANLLELSDEYALAIETALGGALQNIVVEDETAAKRAIYYLKQESVGRATFLPITSIKGNRLQYNSLEQEDGVIGLAYDLIRCDDTYQSIFVNLLGRTVVVQDLDHGVNLAKQHGYRFKIVTLDGQLIHAGGSLTGGAKGRSSGILSRRNEIQKLQKQVGQAEERQRESMQKQEEQQAQMEEMEAKLKGIESELIVVSEDQIRYEGEKRRLKEQLIQAQNWIQSTENEIKQLQAQKKDLEDSLHQTNQQLVADEQEMEQVQEKIQALQSSHDQLQQKRQSLESKMNQERILRAEQIKEKESRIAFLEELISRSDGHVVQVKQVEESLQQKQEDMQRIDGEIAALEQEIANTKEGQAGIDAEIETAFIKKAEAEKMQNQGRSKERELLEHKEKFGLALARAEERAAALQKENDQIIARLWEVYNLSVPQAQDLSKPVSDVCSANKELQRLKSQIKRLGQINLGAIDEYQEVSQRYTFLKDQIADAEKSKKELSELIKELTQHMETRFLDTFQKINTQFQYVFTQLFGGGKGTLCLEDSENLLECGIRIDVQPPGKIIKNLSALSGGEKAFVAIAIYFAILKVNPSPFCILDEIEAALDDVNVDKFASYLNQLRNNTQFIVITHRRGTMEQADVLYGVTMQEEGVSKLLELRVSETERAAAFVK